MRSMMFAAACGLVSATPAIAQDASPKPVAASEMKSCRSAVATGSIMSKKTCYTRAQWAAIDKARERQFEKARTNTLERAQGGAKVGEDSFGQGN